MYVHRFLFNTCEFNALIFENIVKNLWAIIEDIDEDQRSGEKNVAKKNIFDTRPSYTYLIYCNLILVMCVLSVYHLSMLPFFNLHVCLSFLSQCYTLTVLCAAIFISQ